MTLLRLALRIGVRGGWRTLVYPLVAFVPLVLIMAGVTAANSITSTGTDIAVMTRSLAPEAFLQGAERATYDRALSRLKGVATPSSVRVESTLVIRSTGGVDVPPYNEADWGSPASVGLYRAVDGRFPSAIGEVALSQPVAEKLHASVGDKVRLSSNEAPLRVVGVVVNRLAHDTPAVLAPQGTWWTLGKSPAEVTRSAVSLQFDPSVDLGKVLAALGESAGGPGYTANIVPPPFYIQQSLLVLLPVVLALAAVLGALVLIRFRRFGSDLSVASGLGLTDERVRWLTVSSYLVTVAPAAILGGLAGVPLGAWVTPMVARAANRDAAVHGFPWGALIVVVATCIVATALMAAAISNRLVRELHSGAAARPATDAISVRGGRRWLSLTVTAIGLVFAFLGYTNTSADADTSNNSATLLLSAGVVLVLAGASAPLLRLGAAAFSKAGIGVRFPLVQVGRDRGRSVAILLVALAAFAFPLSVLVNQQSIQRLYVVSYHPVLLPGQIKIAPQGRDLTEAEIKAISEAAGARVVQLHALGKPVAGNEPPPWWNLLMADPNNPYNTVTFVDSVDDITAVSGYRPTTGDVKALRSGAVLVFNGQVRAPASILLQDDNGTETTRPVAVHHAEAPVDDITSNAFSAVVLRSSFRVTSEQQPVYGFYRILGGADHIDIVRAIAADQGIVPTEVEVDQPYPPPRNVSAEITLAVAYALACLLILVLAAGTLRERDKDLRQLRMLGAPGTVIRSTATILVTWPVFLGIVLGTLAGIICGAISFMPQMRRQTDASLVIPIEYLGIGTLIALTIAITVSSAKARSINRGRG